MTDGALLDVRGLEAGYVAGRPVLTGLEFSVSAGQSVAVLGPNGGGKTTLFRALLEETPQRHGEISLAGDVAYVPQTERSRLDFPADALEVVLMGTYGRLPWYRRVGRRQRALAEDALERVGLADQAGTQYGALSGGQRQRVLLARSLAQEARILLLDEPLTGVDQASSERVLSLLRDLRDEGHAILVSTHDIRQAGDFDLVLCLNGAQVGFGAPEEVLTPQVLERTYGSELVTLPGGEQAVVVQHHSH